MSPSEARLGLHDVIKMLVAPVPAQRERDAGLTTSSPWLSMREAMPVAGKLYAHGDVTYARLAAMSGPLLEELGVTSPEARKKTVSAIRAALDNPEWNIKLRRFTGGTQTASPSAKEKRKFTSKAMATVGNSVTPGSASTTTPPRKRRKEISPETLARDWGDTSGSSVESAQATHWKTYKFNEVYDLHTLRGRTVVVNRAPVLTAWVTVILEKMGFERDEALSLAHCYVSHTSTARGLNIGAIPKTGPGARPPPVGVGTNQPHFELMGVKIPVMQVQGGIDEDGDENAKRYRGINQGQMVPPDKAYDYLRSSMMMNLPFVMGAMHLLADAIVEDGPGDPDPQRLDRAAWHLYCEFRPDTGGEWGKKASLSVNKILLLRPHATDLDQAEDTDKKPPPDIRDDT